MDKLQKELSTLELNVKPKMKDELLDEINRELAKVEITSKSEVKVDSNEDALKVKVKIEPIEDTSNVEVKVEPTEDVSKVVVKDEPTDDTSKVKVEQDEDVSKVEVKLVPIEEDQLEKDSSKHVEVESESESEDESEESDDESEKIYRGPIRPPSRTNIQHYPYNILPEHQYENYHYNHHYHQGLPYNIPPLIIPTPEEQRWASSQTLLSGGGQIQNLIPEIEEVSPEVEAAEVDKVLQSLISDDPLYNWPLDIFDDYSLSDTVTNENEILDGVIRIEQDYNLGNRNYNDNNTSFGESEPNSPYSSGSSDQVVYSPRMSFEESNSPRMYPLECNSPLSDVCSDLSLTIVQANEIPQTKYVRILPKPSNGTTNRNSSNKTNNERRIGPRNKYLNVDKSKRDEYHRRMLKLSDKGLGIKTRDGYSLLHTLIAAGETQFAIYFLDILNLWLKHDDNAVKLKGIESIHSFVDSSNNQGQTALYLAALLNQDMVCECLIDLHKANVHLADYENGDTPFHVVCRSGENFSKVLKAFLRHKDKFDLQVVNNKGRTGLHEAVRCHGGLRCHCENDRQTVKEVINNVGTVKELLHAGAAIDVQDEDGFTPIHFAVKNKSLTLLDVLFEYGALCNFDKALLMPDNMGRTPLMLAYKEDDEKLRIALQEKICSYDAL